MVKNLPSNAGDTGWIPGQQLRSHMPQSNKACEPQLQSPHAPTRESVHCKERPCHDAVKILPATIKTWQPNKHFLKTKTRPLYMLSTRDPLQNKGHIQTKSEGLEKNISCKRRPKESRSCNTHDFQIKTVKRDKEGHYIMIKGSTQEEDITIINIYAPNIGAPQYVRQILMRMKEEINSNTK